MREVVFIADASVQIGAGHVERCIALAEQLYARGWRCIFLSSDESVSTVPALRRFEVLPVQRGLVRHSAAGLKELLPELLPDRCALVVVDHYNWGADQESACRSAARVVMAIDDLADRRHDCDILLDQTVGRHAVAYKGLLPSHCHTLVGAQFALLRPEFAALRPTAVAERRARQPNRVLVNFGGTDPHGNTLLALQALRTAGLDVSIDVVMGARAPFLEEVRAVCGDRQVNATLHVSCTNMAEVMSSADVAIGAAGVAAVERCVVGLPSLVVIDADNQKSIAAGLARLGAISVLGHHGSISRQGLASAISDLFRDRDRLWSMSEAALGVSDGLGSSRVAETVESLLAS